MGETSIRTPYCISYLNITNSIPRCRTTGLHLSQDMAVLRGMLDGRRLYHTGSIRYGRSCGGTWRSYKDDWCVVFVIITCLCLIFFSASAFCWQYVLFLNIFFIYLFGILWSVLFVKIFRFIYTHEHSLIMILFSLNFVPFCRCSINALYNFFIKRLLIILINTHIHIYIY